MDVIVFSDLSSVNVCFKKLEKSKGFSVKYHPLADIRRAGSSSPAGSVLYADFTGLARPAVKKNLSILNSLSRVFGVIDSKGTPDDPALLFHSGASDYIGKGLFKEGIDPARLKKVYDFGRRSLPEHENNRASLKTNSAFSGRDWGKIVSGKEYTFCFMYIELDNQKELKKRFPDSSLEDFTKKFYNLVEKSVSDIKGRVWMWTNFGGLILIPTDGESCPAILTGIRLMLNRRIICFEEFDYDMILSYRIAIHIGDTVYQHRGNTGKIVSDSVNSIHHLKENFAEPGQMYLTEDTYKLMPEGLEKLFIKAGNYEGREIYRLLSLM